MYMQVSKLYGYALCVCGWICVYRVYAIYM